MPSRLRRFEWSQEEREFISGGIYSRNYIRSKPHLTSFLSWAFFVPNLVQESRVETSSEASCALFVPNLVQSFGVDTKSEPSCARIFELRPHLPILYTRYTRTNVARLEINNLIIEWLWPVVCKYMFGFQPSNFWNGQSGLPPSGTVHRISLLKQSWNSQRNMTLYSLT